MVTEGKPQDDRLRRHELRGRRPRRRGAARRRAARRLRDRRAQDLRPRVERDDLLRGASSASVHDHERHHRADAATWRRTSSPTSGRRRRHRAARPGRRGRRGQRHPGPRLLLQPARHRPRVRHSGSPAAASATRSTDRRPDAHRRPGMPSGSPTRADRRPGRLRPLRRAHRPRRRPDRARPRRGCSGGSTQMGMRPISLAVDVTNYVMLAARAAAARLRPRHARRHRSWCAGPGPGRR